MGDKILLKIEIKKSEYMYPNSDDDKKADLLMYTILVTGSNGETNVYLMEETFWNRLEPKLRKFVKKMFDRTQTEITKMELLK